MKFWRRHKHELERTDADEPLPVAPEKKMRYSRQDDVLIAKHFLDKPEGTSDKVFQAFARIVSVIVNGISWYPAHIHLESSSSLERMAGAPPNPQSQD